MRLQQHPAVPSSHQAPANRYRRDLAVCSCQPAPAVPLTCCGQVNCAWVSGIKHALHKQSMIWLLSYANRFPVLAGLPAPGASTRAASLGWHAAVIRRTINTCQSMYLIVLGALAAALVPEDKELATRLHSQTMLNKLAPVIPGFWGGSAGEQGRTAGEGAAQLSLQGRL